MGKVRTITIDGIIPIHVFYSTFYHHFEATSFAKEAKKEFSWYWHGEAHANGEFEIGYHSPKYRQRGGLRIGEYQMPHQIRGKLIHENEKTMIQYEYKSDAMMSIVLAVFSLVIFCTCFSNIKSGSIASVLSAVLSSLCFIICICWASPIFMLRRFAKKFNAMIEDCKKSSEA